VLATRETFRTLKTTRRQAGIGGLRSVLERLGRMVDASPAAIARDTGLMRCTIRGVRGIEEEVRDPARVMGMPDRAIISPRRSRLRRLHTASLCHLSNVGGKLWIPREHEVESIFVERVEVTVIDRADTGSAGLAEE